MELVCEHDEPSKISRVYKLISIRESHQPADIIYTHVPVAVAAQVSADCGVSTGWPRPLYTQRRLDEAPSQSLERRIHNHLLLW